MDVCVWSCVCVDVCGVVCVYGCRHGEFVPLYCLLAHTLGNGTGRRLTTMVTPLLLTSGLVRYEAGLHSCGTSPLEEGGTDL